MAETTYEDMTDKDLIAVVEALERRLAGASARGAGTSGRDNSDMSVEEIESELNLARAVLAARALHQGLP